MTAAATPDSDPGSPAPAAPPLQGRGAEVAHTAQAVLGARLPPAQLAALDGFLAELARWNATHNLTAVRDPAQMRAQHLADCLAIVPLLRRHLQQRPPGAARARLLDVGSGGGLPGAVLAIVLPELDVTCIDAVAKKVAFIRHVAGGQSLANLRAVHGRVEAHRTQPAYDVVCSRAFASLADFTALTRHALAPGGVWMAMKGKVPEAEIAALPADLDVFHVEPIQVPGLDAQRCVVWIRRRTEA